MEKMNKFLQIQEQIAEVGYADFNYQEIIDYIW